MTDYSNRPGGVLFVNNRKTNPNHPDFTGNIVLDPACMQHLVDQWQAGQPVKLELSAWKKTGPKSNFISISSKIPYDQQNGGQKKSKPAPATAWDDDIPF